MAKKNIEAADEVNSIIVPCWRVYHRQKKNYGRHISMMDGEIGHRAKAVLLKAGYDKNQTIVVTPLNAAEKLEVEAEIWQEWERLLSNTVAAKYPAPCNQELTAEQERAGFRALYIPDGKTVRVPDLDGVFGFQRGKAYWRAIALNIADGMSAEDAVDRMKLPVRIKTFASEAERIDECALENTRKDAGRVSIVNSWPSLYQIGKRYFDAAGGQVTQSTINRIVCGGEVKNNNSGIWVHSMLMLDCAFPELDITNRLLNGGDLLNNKGIVIGDKGQEFADTLDRTCVWKLAQYLSEAKVNSDTPLALAEPNKFPIKPQLTTMPIVKEYFDNPAGFKAVVVTPVGKASIESNKNMTNNMFEKFVLWVCQDESRLTQLSRLRHPSVSLELLREINALAETIGICKDGVLK